MQKKFILFLVSSLILITSFQILSNISVKLEKDESRYVIKAPDSLSDEEHEKLKTKILSYVNSDNPKVAIAELKKAADGNTSVSKSCHLITHEIGHATFEKYKSFAKAMEHSSEFCGSGYMHGIIEAQFLELEGSFNQIKTICETYPPGKFLTWQCYHGIGHGLMYFNGNNLPESLKECDSLDIDFPKKACLYGVFMENFAAEQKFHPSDYLKPSDPFYPCNEQNADHKNACYLYAPSYFLSLNKSNYSKAIEWCKTAEDEYIASCIAGVAIQATSDNMNNPKLVENFCMSLGKNPKNICLSAFVSRYLADFGEIKKAESLCPRMKKQNQSVCKFAIDAQRSQFE